MHFPFDPADQPRTAPAIWHARDCAFVLTLSGSISNWPQLVECRALGKIILDRTGPEGRHLVLQTNGLRHRLLLQSENLKQGPSFILPADGQFTVRSAALAAFQLHADKPVSLPRARAMQPTTFQHHRLRLILAVLDARGGADLVPASLQQVAAAISGGNVLRERAIDWKTSSRRRQVQRLIAEGRQLVESGYRDLLKARFPTKGAAAS